MTRQSPFLNGEVASSRSGWLPPAWASAEAELDSGELAATPCRECGRVDSEAPRQLGGVLRTFTAQTLGHRVAVYVSPAALGRSEVDVLLFVHGLLGGCERPKSVPDGFISASPFALGRVVDGASQPVVLIVPLLDWKHPGGETAFGPKRPRWSALAKPASLNSLIAEALAQAAGGGTSLGVRRLIVAGHSRAYDFLEPLASSADDPEMQQGALAKLERVWALDTTYSGDVRRWRRWLDSRPGLRVHFLYRPWTFDSKLNKLVASGTSGVGAQFFRSRGDRLEVTRCREGHCQVPGRRLPELLRSLSEGTAQESRYLGSYELSYETPFAQLGYEAGDDEAGDDELAFEAGDDEASDDELAFEAGDDEAGDDELAFEAGDDEAGDDELAYEAGDDEAGTFERAGTADFESFREEPTSEWEDEGEHSEERQLDEAEEEAAIGSPLPVPPDNPVPFAPEPAPGAYWPVRTKHKSARLISYRSQSAAGIVGYQGRMFLANRKGKKQGQSVGRWHVGVDLFCYRGDEVFACEDGKIVDFRYFYKASTGQATYKILIEHEGVVVNYGEVTANSLKGNGLKVHMPVKAGQRIGWVSDTDMLHVETYRRGTKDTARWWKSEPTPPAELRNPTRYLLALAAQGRAPGAGGGAIPAPTPASSATPSAELVRFAQTVLNAIDGLRLDEDGDPGPKTRAALQNFRQFHQLGSGSTLDAATTLALAQRALEQLARASMFSRVGVLDDRTRDELSRFKLERGLGFGADVDAATRSALRDALKGKPKASTASSPPVTGSSSAPTAPITPASADWIAYIDRAGELPATVLASVQSARTAFPARKIVFSPYKKNRNPKLHRGYTQSKVDGGAHARWSRSWVEQNVINGGSRVQQLAGKAFRALFEREGSTADLNMYDNQIVTYGTGFGGLGSLQELFAQLDTTRAGAILRGAGFAWRQDRYHIVDLRTKRVVSSALKGKAAKRHRAPLEAMRQQDDFLAVLIGLALDPATREIVIAEMWKKFYKMAANFKGADQIQTGALFNFISHMHLWLPACAKGGLAWALTKSSGGPSIERDKQLALSFARYFTKAAFVLDRKLAATDQPKKDYGAEVVSRLPGNPWHQLISDGKSEQLVGLEPLHVEDGSPPSYPSDAEVKQYWKVG